MNCCRTSEVLHNFGMSYSPTAFLQTCPAGVGRTTISQAPGANRPPSLTPPFPWVIWPQSGGDGARWGRGEMRTGRRMELGEVARSRIPLPETTSCSDISAWFGFSVSFSFSVSFFAAKTHVTHTQEASRGLVSYWSSLFPRARRRASWCRTEAAAPGLCPGLGHFSGSHTPRGPYPLHRTCRSLVHSFHPPRLGLCGCWRWAAALLAPGGAPIPFPLFQPHASE